MSTKNKIKLDEYHYHEALDRTHLINSIIENHLIDHPVFNNHEILKMKINQISDSLSQIYQIIGSISIDKDSKK